VELSWKSSTKQPEIFGTTVTGISLPSYSTYTQRFNFRLFVIPKISLDEKTRNLKSCSEPPSHSICSTWQHTASAAWRKMQNFHITAPVKVLNSVCHWLLRKVVQWSSLIQYHTTQKPYSACQKRRGIPTTIMWWDQNDVHAVESCPGCPLTKLKGGRRSFSSQLQFSWTHCRFTFAPRPSVAVSFEQGSRLIFSGWPFTDFFSENYWRDWT